MSGFRLLQVLSRAQMVLPLVLMSISLLPAPVRASDTPGAHAQPEQSFQTCGLISSELVTLTQALLTGASEEEVRDSLNITRPSTLNNLHRIAESLQRRGAEAVLLAIHQDYARCAKRVYDTFGLPPAGTAEHAFQVCAGESRIRTEIILAARQGARFNDLAHQLPEDHHPILRQLIEVTVQEGALAALYQSASQIKQCMNAVARARVSTPVPGSDRRLAPLFHAGVQSQRRTHKPPHLSPSV